MRHGKAAVIIGGSSLSLIETVVSKIIAVGL